MCRIFLFFGLNTYETYSKRERADAIFFIGLNLLISRGTWLVEQSMEMVTKNGFKKRILDTLGCFWILHH